MKDNFYTAISDFWQINIINYIQGLSQKPLRIISLILDLAIVIFLIYKLLKTTKIQEYGN